ncbi:MAG TPA: hypothetical protein VGG34_09110 [Opitutaceae bacterium]
MRFWVWAAAVLAAVVALGCVAWTRMLPGFVERQLDAATGFDVRVRVLSANPLTGRIAVRGLSATNPRSYPASGFIELRSLDADVNAFSWFTGRVVIDNLDIDTAKLVLIRQRNGTSNASQFIAAFSSRPQAASGPPPKPMQYLIKRLRIRLSELDIEDYSGITTFKRTYKLNIDQSYTDVSNPRQLIVPGVVRTLYNFGLHRYIAQLLPGDFGRALDAAVGSAAKLGSDVTGAAKHAGSVLRGLFDKLEQSPKP